MEAKHVLMVDDFLLFEYEFILHDCTQVLLAYQVLQFLLDDRVLLSPGHHDNVYDLLLLYLVEVQSFEVVVVDVVPIPLLHVPDLFENTHVVFHLP